MSALELFKNSYSVLILTILLAVVFVSLTQERKKSEYIKGIVLAVMTSLLIITINNVDSIKPEEILTGIAPF